MQTVAAGTQRKDLHKCKWQAAIRKWAKGFDLCKDSAAHCLCQCCLTAKAKARQRFEEVVKEG